MSDKSALTESLSPVKDGDVQSTADALQAELGVLLQGSLREKNLVRRDALKLMGTLAVAAAGAFVLFRIVLGYGRIKGSSMEPALREGDWYLIRRIADVKRGDIAVLRAEDNIDVVKRIVGMPGDKVNIRAVEGAVEINGKRLKESYVFDSTYPKTNLNYPIVLESGHYFVLGDNRSNSMDSRNYGPISKEQIEGMLVAILRFN